MRVGTVSWRAVRAAALATALSACSGTTAPAEVTYYRDVKSIVDAKCVTCHQEGGIAPFALTAPEDVVFYARAIQAATAAKTMPPWPPGAGCTDYARDRSLTADQIKTIGSWAAAGGKLGVPVAATPLPPQVAGLSRIDYKLTIPEAYTPQKHPDDYRCFLVDWPATTTKYVTGIGVAPGQPSIVHHVLVFAATPATLPSYQALDDADAGPGWACFAGPGGSALPSLVGGWAPGASGADFPPDTGIRIEAGSKLIVQVHYHPGSAPPPADQSTVNLKVDDEVAKEALALPWTNPWWPRLHTMSINAGDRDATHSFAFDALTGFSFATSGKIDATRPVTIHSAALHMHLHGTQATLNLQKAAGTTECLLTIPRWDFHWQGSYAFANPKQVAPGDKLGIECHWDNSISTQPVDASGQPLSPRALNWGEGTTDEMCLGFVYVTQ